MTKPHTVTLWFLTFTAGGRKTVAYTREPTTAAIEHRRRGRGPIEITTAEVPADDVLGSTPSGKAQLRPGSLWRGARPR